MAMTEQERNRIMEWVVVQTHRRNEIEREIKGTRNDAERLLLIVQECKTLCSKDLDYLSSRMNTLAEKMRELELQRDVAQTDTNAFTGALEREPKQFSMPE